MSWDVIILRAPAGITRVSDLPDGFDQPLGSREEVVRAICAAFPSANSSDPTWMVLDGDEYSIEFSLGQNKSIEYLMLYIRGTAQAVDAVQHLCETTGWRAFDTAAGEFIDFTSPSRYDGVLRWQDYKTTRLTQVLT